MLGSRYNDSKERLENRRSSFFLTSSAPTLPSHAGGRRIHSTGSSATANDNEKHSHSVPLRRHTLAKTRSLDGIHRAPMSSEPFHANNPQDDYGSTAKSSFSSENETPLLSSTRRTQSLACLNHRSSCADLSNLDEKPVSFFPRVLQSFSVGWKLSSHPCSFSPAA